MRDAIIKCLIGLLMLMGLLGANACGQNMTMIVINNTPTYLLDGIQQAKPTTDLPTWWDFGDAPDPPYPTLLKHDGARHNIALFGPLFCPSEDSSPEEIAGLAAKWAVGDDDNDAGDEDGIAFDRTLNCGHDTKIKIAAWSMIKQAKLNAWIDFNRDRDWADKGEQIFKDVNLVNGENDLVFKVPKNAKPGITYARFRISTEGGLSYSGSASNGEVQDYFVEIKCPHVPCRGRNCRP